MAGAGAPEGLPLNFRFSPDLSGQNSPTLQWGTLILVTLKDSQGHALSFPVDFFRFTSVFLCLRGLYLKKPIPKKGGKSALLLV